MPDITRAGVGMWRGPEEPGEFPSLGHEVASWIESNLIIPDGVKRGQPFILTDEQYRHLLWTYRLKPNARSEMGSQAFSYYGALLVRPQKAGKDPLAAAQVCAQALGPVRFDGWDAAGEPVGAPMATPWIQCAANSEDQPLALDTEVPTPGGWTTVGELRVGDHVFGSDGRACEVRRATRVLRDLDCYRITFDDGVEVVCSASHSWTVERWDRHETGWTPTTRSTAELASDYVIARHQDKRRYRLPLAPIEMPVAELPVDPWILGLWLGDGSASDATIALDWRLKDEYEALLKPVLSDTDQVVWSHAAGNGGTFRIRRRPGVCPAGHDYAATDDFSITSQGHPTCGECKRGARGSSTAGVTLRERLKAAGVLGNKHIPLSYLRASYDQRWALLQGLIDSDGNVTTKGRVGFVNANEQLFDQAVQLIKSLGFRVAITRAAGTARRAWFRPDSSRPVARLAAKYARQQPYTRGCRSGHRWITEIQPAVSVPVRCIGIDVPDHLFQVTRSHVLTHNTDNTFRPIFGMLAEGPVSSTPGLDVGMTRINLPDGGRIEPVTAAAKSRLGARITFATFTESALYTESSGGANMARTMKRGLAGMDGRWMECTNAWDPSERSVAQRTWESKAPGVFLDYRQPRVRVDLDDDQALRAELAYVYGDAAIDAGGWVRIERIMDEIRDASTGEGEARRFYLNEVTVGSRDAVDMIKWTAQKDSSEPLQKRQQVALGFHGSQNRDATSLCASRLSDGRIYHLRTWERAPGEADWTVPREEVHQAVRDAFKAFEVEAMFCTPTGWQTEVNVWDGQYPKKVYELWTNSELRMDQLVERFQTAHRGDELTHDGTEILTMHAAGAALANGKRRSTAEERVPGQPEHYQRIVKKSHAQSISAFMAALLAYEARGWAIEHGSLAKRKVPNLW